MGSVISFVSQKGGVGKSTLARAIAREAAKSGLAVKVADLDTQQGTVAEWHRQRLNKGHEPIGSVEVYAKASEALKVTDDYDLLILDAAARASVATLEIARKSDLVVLPTSASLDDLMPAVRLAHELKNSGIPKSRMAFALTKVSTLAEIEEAREYITSSGYYVLDGELLEKPGYREAQNAGLSVRETRFKTLNAKADELLGSMYNRLIEIITKD